jgi:hypothetical protein
MRLGMNGGGATPVRNPYCFDPVRVGWVNDPAPVATASRLFIGKFCRLLKYMNEHGTSQLAGLGVLVRGMVRS